ncbi:MAG TPA: ribosome-associated translation inhibitor RaiA [Lacunisphaera sp.]
MSTQPTPDTSPTPIIARGIHLDLTPALRQAVTDKCDRLLRHEHHIVRLRIDLELDKTHAGRDLFVAKGRVEIRGPDLLAHASSEDAYKSLDLLVDKLDELLRRRHQKRINTRNDDRRQAPKQGEE